MAYALSDDIKRYFARPEKLARLGEIFGVEVYPEGLGCGFYGCVYETDSPFVIKVTSDVDEGPMWERLRQLQQVGEIEGGLPKIERVVQLDPEKGQLKTFTVYAALREDVAQAPPWVSKKDFISILYDYGLEARRLPRDDQRLLELADAVSEYRPESKELGDLLYRLAELGIPPADLHEGNIGQRSDAQFGEPGQLLFIDPGTKSVEEKVTERFAANVVRTMGRPKLEGVDMSRLPKAPPPRRISGHAPSRAPERRMVRRIVEEYEEEERPFDPAVPPARYAKPHHFAVNARASKVERERQRAVGMADRRAGDAYWQTQGNRAEKLAAAQLAAQEFVDAQTALRVAQAVDAYHQSFHHGTKAATEAYDEAFAENPDEGELIEEIAIHWPLTGVERDSLSYIAARYESGERLYYGYDEDTEMISAEDAVNAFIATGADGGDIGTVPLAGGRLKEKIDKLWELSNAWDYVDDAKAYQEQEDDALDALEANARCPVGTEVQTLIFDPESFNKTEAKRWAKDQGFKSSKVDETRDSYRIRQKDPRSYKKGSFRTIELASGVKAVVGCPR